MLYKLTWQTRHYRDVWGEQQFVIGSHAAIHKCYNALLASFKPNYLPATPSVRAVVTAITGDDDTAQNIVYEWGWRVAVVEPEIEDESEEDPIDAMLRSDL